MNTEFKPGERYIRTYDGSDIIHYMEIIRKENKNWYLVHILNFGYTITVYKYTGLWTKLNNQDRRE